MCFNPDWSAKEKPLENSLINAEIEKKGAQEKIKHETICLLGKNDGKMYDIDTKWAKPPRNDLTYSKLIKRKVSRIL